MTLLKNIIKMVILVFLFSSCDKKDISNLKSEITNIREDSIKEIKKVHDINLITDSTVWNQYKIIREADVEDTLPYKNCKIVLFNNKFFKYYVNEVIKLQDTLIPVMISEKYKRYRYKALKYDTCLYINEKNNILDFSSCNPNASFISEYFEKN